MDNYKLVRLTGIVFTNLFPVIGILFFNFDSAGVLCFYIVEVVAASVFDSVRFCLSDRGGLRWKDALLVLSGLWFFQFLFYLNYFARTAPSMSDELHVVLKSSGSLIFVVYAFLFLYENLEDFPKRPGQKILSIIFGRALVVWLFLGIGRVVDALPDRGAGAPMTVLVWSMVAFRFAYDVFCLLGIEKMLEPKV